MRYVLPAALLLATAVAPAASAQRTHQHDNSSNDDRRPVRQEQEYRFTPALHAGQRLAISNIDGRITVTQGAGSTPEIVAHKRVYRGNGDLVSAVLEPTSDGYRVCTVYRHSVSESTACDGERNHDWNDDEPLDVDVEYDVHLPPGVVLQVNSVDGNVVAHGIDAAGEIHTVDGSITFEGAPPTSLQTVDGAIDATFSAAQWREPSRVRTVDGQIDLTLSDGVNTEITGETVDGDVDSDFAVTVTGKWGPHSFHGTIGNGSGPGLIVRSVDGGIHLHRTGTSHGTDHGR